MKQVSEILQENKWQTVNGHGHEAPEKTRTITRAKLDDLDTSHPKVRAAVEKARKWAARKRDYPEASLVLCGPVGTGKTHIARAILWSISLCDEAGTPICPAGKFFHAMDLLMRSQPTKTDWGGTDIPRPSSYIGTAPIVVIDDVGAEGNIPFVKGEEQLAEKQSRYFRAIDYCYTWRASLIVTSNLSIPQLADHLGGRCWDRLSEMAPRGFMYAMTGVPSWRKKESGRNG